jgi:hypothetical protein
VQRKSVGVSSREKRKRRLSRSLAENEIEDKESEKE